jgi:hypothetical protein
MISSEEAAEVHVGFFENYWFCMPRSSLDDMKPRDENKLWKNGWKVRERE